MITADQALALARANAGACDDLALVMGIMEQESGKHGARGVLVGFDDRAFLPDRNGGSIGLMQLDLPTARQMGFKGDAAGLYACAANVALGARYLAWIKADLTRNCAYSLAANIAGYNEGVGNVLRGNPDPNYVGLVSAYRTAWQIKLDGAPS
jgi:soluble lytic murein transglycosylase-like protein